MRKHLLMFTAIVFLAAASTPFAGDNKKDHDLIQGKWTAISYAERGEESKGKPEESIIHWAFKGDKFTLLDFLTGSFKLNETKTPKTIDMTFPAAKGEKKQDVQGIYELSRDTLKLCYAPDGGKRPTEFKTTKDTKDVFIVFKKAAK